MTEHGVKTQPDEGLIFPDARRGQRQNKLRLMFVSEQVLMSKMPENGKQHIQICSKFQLNDLTHSCRAEGMGAGRIYYKGSEGGCV